MPLGQPPLPQATIDVIRQWISDGAQSAAPSASQSSDRTSAAAPAAAMKPAQLHAIAPLPGEVLRQSPAEIVVASDQALNVSTLDTNSIVLLRSGGDAGFADGNEIGITGIRVSIRSLMPTVLALTLPAENSLWVADTYRLTILGQGPAPATSLSGGAIDGAGEGRGGSDFVLQFSVLDP